MCRPFEGRVAGQDTQDKSPWGRRGWLVLLRARHQRIAAARARLKWLRTVSFSTKRDVNDLLLLTGVECPQDEHDLEGGHWRLARVTVVFRCRQLLKWVVECEEDGIFRNVVGYV